MTESNKPSKNNATDLKLKKLDLEGKRGSETSEDDDYDFLTDADDDYDFLADIDDVIDVGADTDDKTDSADDIDFGADTNDETDTDCSDSDDETDFEADADDETDVESDTTDEIDLIFGSPSTRELISKLSPELQEEVRKSQEECKKGIAKVSTGTHFPFEKFYVGHIPFPMPQNKHFYDMTNKNRGVAVIFNHASFMEDLELDTRLGSDVDVKSLKECFEKLGFAVQVHLDLSVAEIETVLEELRKMDHSDNDCFVLVCMSHGTDSGESLYAHDAVYKADLLWSKFTEDKCPSLVRKPKIFIVQGINVLTEVEANPNKKPPNIEFDSLISYCQVPDYISCKDEEKTGSRFIQGLCEELNDIGLTFNTHTLMEMANLKVAEYYELCAPDGPVTGEKKRRNPCIKSLFMQLLRFTEKDEPDTIITP